MLSKTLQTAERIKREHLPLVSVLIALLKCNERYNSEDGISVRYGSRVRIIKRPDLHSVLPNTP